MHSWLSLLLLGPFTLGSQAQATFPQPGMPDPCYGSAVFRDLENIEAYIEKAAVYGDTDRRKTESEFAKMTGEPLKTIRKRFAPTGTLTCGSLSEGSAQITIENDIITTAGHMLEGTDPNDSDKCIEFGKPTDCVFTIQIEGKRRDIKVKELIGSGYHCPKPVGRQDWAVMRLESPVPEVTPYKVDPDQVKKMKVGDKVINVSHSADFIRVDPKTGEAVFPKHIGNCQIMRVYSDPDPFAFKTDCDSAGYSSGGGILSGNEDSPTLLAIHAKGSETKDQLHNAQDRIIRGLQLRTPEALKNGQPNKAPYNDQFWMNIYIPLAGEFLETLKKASTKKPESINIPDKKPTIEKPSQDGINI